MTNLINSSEEKWIDIAGYEGIYSISTLGRVKRLKGSHQCYNDRFLKPKTKQNGYQFVCLCIGNSLKYFHIHRLVAAAFIPNPDTKPQVNHIDLNKANNRLINLEWATQSENMLHLNSLAKPAIAYKSGSAHASAKPVRQLDLNGNLLKIWGCGKEAAIFYNCSEGGIYRVCKKKRGGKTFVGYKWEYN